MHIKSDKDYVTSDIWHVWYKNLRKPMCVLIESKVTNIESLLFMYVGNNVILAEALSALIYRHFYWSWLCLPILQNSGHINNDYDLYLTNEAFIV